MGNAPRIVTQVKILGGYVGFRGSWDTGGGCKGQVWVTLCVMSGVGGGGGVLNRDP